MERDDANSLGKTIVDAALAFRGYNVTNLGRTPELLATPAYQSIVQSELDRYSQIARDAIKAPVNLAANVSERREFDLDRYPQAVALVIATEFAQLRLLREVHGIDYTNAKLAFGFSLGELAAVCCTGALSMEDVIRVPLTMAHDCANLAHDSTLGILFSRGEILAEEKVHRLCVKITSEGRGVIGVSAILSPNSYLVIGQGDAMASFKAAMNEWLSPGVHLRVNDDLWPPLHTPIMRQRHIPDRAATAMEALVCRPFPARPAVVSLVTGKRDYNEFNAREILRRWVDHPQRLWDAVCETLAADVKLLLHIGPAPNVIPATFARLSENVRQQTVGRSLESYGMRAMARMARRPWLASLLPARAALLRAPLVRHITLEDWLLDNAPT